MASNLTIQDNNLGYGVRLVNPEGFIRAVIFHFFSPLPKSVNMDDLLHEARVALYEQDLRLGKNIPQNTGAYWWRVAEAVGRLLWEDYRFEQMLARGHRPFNDGMVYEDNPETIAHYLEKQAKEEIGPADEVAAKEWFDHYLSLAEGVILDSENAEQGERDLQLFELWVNGCSPKEIAERPEITWVRTYDSVDREIRRIIKKLWDFFGVNSEEQPMMIGDHQSHTTIGQKKRFARWYANPENRRKHQEKCRDRKRQMRAEEKKAKDGQ